MHYKVKVSFLILFTTSIGSYDWQMKKLLFGAGITKFHFFYYHEKWLKTTTISKKRLRLINILFNPMLISKKKLIIIIRKRQGVKHSRMVCFRYIFLTHTTENVLLNVSYAHAYFICCNIVRYIRIFGKSKLIGLNSSLIFWNNIMYKAYAIKVYGKQ